MNIKDLEDIERLERLEQTLVELKELADSGAIIVVEGKRDVHSLNILGITDDIRQATLYPLLEFTESLGNIKQTGLKLHIKYSQPATVVR